MAMLNTFSNKDLNSQVMENFFRKNYMAFLLSVKKDAYRRILRAKAYSRAEILVHGILKLGTGTTTLKNHLSFQKFGLIVVNKFYIL